MFDPRWYRTHHVRGLALAGTLCCLVIGGLVVSGCDSAENGSGSEVGLAPGPGIEAGVGAGSNLVAMRVKMEQAAKLLAHVAADPAARTELKSLVEVTEGPHDEAITFPHLIRPEVHGLPATAARKAKVARRGAFASAFRNLSGQTRALASANLTTSGVAGVERFLMRHGLQVFWPYPEKWDGQTQPVVTFDPLAGESGTGEEAYVAYRLDEDGTLSELMVDEEYALRNPVWVVNVSEAAPEGVVVMPVGPMEGSIAPMETPAPCEEPLEGGGVSIACDGGGGGGGGGGTTCPAPPATEPDYDVSLIKMGYMQVTRQYDSWINGGSEIYISHPKTHVNFGNPSESTVEVSTFSHYFSRGTIDDKKWVPIDQQYISNWLPEVRNQKLAIHEHDPHGPFKFSGKVNVKVPAFGVEPSAEVGFEVTFKSNDPIIYQHDHDRASYFLFNRRGDIDNAGTMDCWRIYKGGSDLKFTLPFINENYSGA